MATATRGDEAADERPVRRRILDAAFSAFIDAGYAATTMLEIARRARVSKRELYAVVGNKQEMLVACIHERATRLRLPVDLPEPHDRDTLEHVLTAVGTQLLRETTNDTVVAVFRLAIAEAVRAPEVAAALDLHGRQAARAALTAIMTQAANRGLIEGRPVALVDQFGGLLWGDLMTSLLLRVDRPPNPQESERRAADAAAAFLHLHAAAGAAGPRPSETSLR